MSQNTTRPAPTAEQFVGNYGHDWKPGVLAEHLQAFRAAGGVVRRSRTGSGVVWAVVGIKAYPFVCGHLIQVDTEDGPVSGRCGLRAVREGACEAHAEEHASWVAMSEAERAAWERDRDLHFSHA